MAPRASWKGFLRLSLVTCPVALYPATSEADKISFNQINKNTGHRIRYVKVDVDTGEEVDPRYMIRPYYLRPDGKVGHDAFAVIRETIRDMNMVAIGRVVLTSREHIIALEPLGKGWSAHCCAIPTKFAPRVNISTRFRTSKSPRICSISPSTL